MAHRDDQPIAWRARIAPAVVLLVGLILTADLAAAWLGLRGPQTAPWWSFLFLMLLGLAMLALTAAVTIDPRPLPLRRALAGAGLVWLVILGFAVIAAWAANQASGLVIPFVLGIALAGALLRLAGTTVEVAELDEENDWVGRFEAVVPFGFAILGAALAAVIVVSVAIGVWNAIVRGSPADAIPWAAVIVVLTAPASTFALASYDSRRAGGGTFYAQAAANRRDSWLLLITMVGVVAATAAIVAASLTFAPVPALWAAAFAAVVGALCAAVAARFGANIILDSASARLADPVRDATLLDVVAELALAADIPAPRT